MFLKKDRQFTLKHKLRIYFFTGLLVALPILGSVWILSVLFVKITDYLYVRLAPLGLDHFWERILWRGAALIFLFLALVLIGMFARNYVGRKLINLGEYLFSKIPVLNKIYSTLKQIFQSFWGEGKTVFRSVVLLEFPRDGVYTLGFLTSEPKGELQEKISPSVAAVFIPTAPNPTTGYLIFVPREKLTKLDIPVEDAFKMIISSGVISPQNQGLNTARG